MQMMLSLVLMRTDICSFDACDKSQALQVDFFEFMTGLWMIRRSESSLLSPEGWNGQREENRAHAAVVEETLETRTLDVERTKGLQIAYFRTRGTSSTSYLISTYPEPPSPQSAARACSPPLNCNESLNCSRIFSRPMNGEFALSIGMVSIRICLSTVISDVIALSRK